MTTTCITPFEILIEKLASFELSKIKILNRALISEYPELCSFCFFINKKIKSLIN